MELIKKHSSYIPLVGVVVILIIIFGTIYASTQHVLRMEANWPQVQMAEDGAAQLNNNATPQSLIGATLDMSNSLAPFTNVYDLTGRTVTGAGYIGGKIAVPPKGVLTAANNKLYSSITWQPRSDVRIAAVIVKAKNYYVLSGRSLTEVEKIKNQTFMMTLFGGALTLVVLGGAFWAKFYFVQTKKKSQAHVDE